MVIFKKTTVMTYDYGQDLDTTYHIQPLYPSTKYPVEDGRSVQTAIQAYVDGGFPADKLVMGLPLYGYQYDGVENGKEMQSAFTPNGDGGAINKPVTYEEILEKQNKGNYQWYTDSTAKASWISDPTSSELITFMDAKNDLPERIQYGKKMELAGIMFWHLQSDAINPGSSLTVQASKLWAGDRPGFKRFPVCAPKSELCNIRSECDSADFEDGALVERPSSSMLMGTVALGAAAVLGALVG